MKSSLRLSTCFRNGQTDVEDVAFTAPYKIMHPFHKGAHSDITLMAASAGLLGGDQFDLDLKFGANSDVTFLSQSYEKVINANGKITQKNISINVGEYAKVRYMPYPAIPFALSNFKSNVDVQIHRSAKFLYMDIFTCGRTGMGEFFKMTRYENFAKFYVDGKLSFADHTNIEPTKFDYTQIGMWKNHSHNGMLYYYAPSKENLNIFIERVRASEKDFSGIVGATFAENGVIVRTLANQGDLIWKFFSKLSEVI